MQTRIVRWVFWAGVAGITLLSLTPSDQLPALGLDGWDKAQHLLAYALLAGAGRLGYRSRANLTALIFGLIILGGLFEVAQSFVPGRTGSIWDALANGAGIALGLSFAAWLQKSR